MTGLSDSLTIGILLVLVFGAVSFYLYSRLGQNEKRVSLLENLLLTLKMNTEASLGGPEFVEAISSATPLSDGDVEAYSENREAAYSNSGAHEAADAANAVDAVDAVDANAEEEAAKLLRSLSTDVEKKERTMDANYESMSVKELQALARQRGLTGVPKHKRDLIDALKKSPGSFPLSPTPLAAGDLEKVDVQEGYTVEDL
jgi:hypothetical protein